jgi:hypothetical protein
MFRFKPYTDILKNYVRASSHSCSPLMLERLAHSDIDRIRLRVAENPKTPVDVLETLALDRNPDVRIAVGSNPSTPPHVSFSLAFDEDPNVRLGLAEDMSTPMELLDKLMEDPNPYVSCRAEQTKEYILSQGKPSTLGCRWFFTRANRSMEPPELRYA